MWRRSFPWTFRPGEQEEEERRSPSNEVRAEDRSRGAIQTVASGTLSQGLSTRRPYRRTLDRASASRATSQLPPEPGFARREAPKPNGQSNTAYKRRLLRGRTKATICKEGGTRGNQGFFSRAHTVSRPAQPSGFAGPRYTPFDA